MTLISSILDSIATVNFSNTEHSTWKIYLGYLLKRYTIADFVTEINYQNGLGTQAGYRLAAQLEEDCRILEISSSALLTSIQTTLNNLQMLGSKHLPSTNTDSGHLWYGAQRWGTPALYLRARDLGYLTSKWDASLAWQELKGVCQAAGNIGVLGADPRDNSYWDFLRRFYDENAETIASFLMFYKVDQINNLGSLEYARDYLWPTINFLFWTGTYFNYCSSMPGYEVSGASFATIIGQMRALNGYQLNNWDRILIDVKNRYITSEWNSPQFCYYTTKYYCTVHHQTVNAQRRLHNNLITWYTLHAFWTALDEVSRSHLRVMLDGTPKGWEYIMSNSTLYDSPSKRWKINSNDSVSDTGTLVGIWNLILMGIIPQAGKGLALPIYDHTYEGMEALNKYWMFDYQNRILKLPIKAGTIRFLFGSTPINVEFPRNGIYEVTFASDWNSVTSSIYVEDLDESLEYIESPITLRRETLRFRGKITAVNARGGKFFDNVIKTASRGVFETYQMLESIITDLKTFLLLPHSIHLQDILVKKTTRAFFQALLFQDMESKKILFSLLEQLTIQITNWSFFPIIYQCTTHLLQGMTYAKTLYKRLQAYISERLEGN